jgi:ubiquinone biosynthesis monooxygenase Coq7
MVRPAGATSHAESTDPLDTLLGAADRALRTLFAPARTDRHPDLPADDPQALGDAERRRSAGLMRVNHAGEVSAQGLYHGQALLSRNTATRTFLEQAAREEGDHLAWCEARLKELGSRPSRLNPLWYLGSLAIGAATAALGDGISLGFVAETERQVEGHLAGHLERLPAGDRRSRRILEIMKSDEAAHGHGARVRGGTALPGPVPGLMRGISRIMTSAAYWV